MPYRTYIYKLTSDRGGAPSAPPPRPAEAPLLTLSICKPAIRRTAKSGDRILGITSHSLAASDGYPLHSVIYAAIVDGAVDAREYYAARSRFRHRPDCIYRFHRLNGTIEHSGRTPLHADPAYRSRDIGQYPYYKNGRTLLSHDFRYFGSAASPIPAQFERLTQIAASLGQGHRVFTESDPEDREIEEFLRMLWKRPTRHTPRLVEDEAYGHAPRQKKSGIRISDAALRKAAADRPGPEF
ncbi:MAG: hypothetical protein NVSMB3_11870 [Acidobacteriaceae bacterium]